MLHHSPAVLFNRKRRTPEVIGKLTVLFPPITFTVSAHACQGWVTSVESVHSRLQLVDETGQETETDPSARAICKWGGGPGVARLRTIQWRCPESLVP